MTETPNILDVKHLTVLNEHTGSKVVNDVSFTIKRGDLVCLTGPSGSGKSTLALALMRLLPRGMHPVAGRIKIGPHDVIHSRIDELAGLRGRLMAIIFQDPLASLNPVLPIGKQVEEPLKLHTKFNAKQRYAQVIALLSKLGFVDPERIYRSFPHELSGGQRQRVMLGMAMILKPQLLVADEPTSSLDFESAQYFFEVLTSLQRELGMSILLITHDMDLIARQASAILHMANGQFVGTAVPSKPSFPDVSPFPSRIIQNKVKPQPFMTVSSLSKTFKRRNFFTSSMELIVALDKVSFHIESGEIIGIVGESGAGKTTLGRCIAGLETADAGKIELQGKAVPPLRTHIFSQDPHPIQVIYQSPYASLNPIVRVGKSIEEAIMLSGLTSLGRKKCVESLLEKVGLPAAYHSRFPNELSGGERQRVAIARCLAAEPKLLIADEPTASLDETNKEQVLAVLKKMAHERGLATLLISHDLKSVHKICSRILRLQNSALEQITDGN